MPDDTYLKESLTYAESLKKHHSESSHIFQKSIQEKIIFQNFYWISILHSFDSNGVMSQVHSQLSIGSVYFPHTKNMNILSSYSGI